jgi:hypothetical protein
MMHVIHVCEICKKTEMLITLRRKMIITIRKKLTLNLRHWKNIKERTRRPGKKYSKIIFVFG